MAQGVTGSGDSLGILAGPSRQYEDVDDVFPGPIDESRNRLAFDQVEPPADQRKPLHRKVDAWRRQVRAARKPWLDGMLVRGGDIGQMISEQGAQMTVDQLVGNGVLLPLSIDQPSPA